MQITVMFFTIHSEEGLTIYLGLSVYYSPELSSLTAFLWRLIDSIVLHASLTALQYSNYLTQLRYSASRFLKTVWEVLLSINSFLPYLIYLMSAKFSTEV